MRLLITGGAGFIGSNFIGYILKKHKSWQIINLDKLTYAGNLDNLKDIEKNPRYKFVKGDICDRKIVNKVMAKVDAVVHMAAESHVDRSIIACQDFVQTNIYGTYLLLEAARIYKIKKFLYIGTDEEYGSIKKGKFKETDPLNPSSAYSASKSSASLLCLAYFKTCNLPIVITRSTNNFGPYQHIEKLIPLFITNLLENKKVPLYGTGKNIRDWLYVLDNCQAIDLVLQKGKVGEIYNIAGQNEKNNLEITKIILEEINKDSSFIEYVKDRLGHDFRYAIDCQKIKKLGFKPKYSFEKAIRETIAWYKNNSWWWKKLKNKEYLEYYKKQYRNR